MANGELPFSFINNRGFQKLKGPNAKKFELVHTFNDNNLRRKVSESASEIKTYIKQSVQNI